MIADDFENLQELTNKIGDWVNNFYTNYYNLKGQQRSKVSHFLIWNVLVETGIKCN